MSASQVRVTVLGTQSEPATQQIITESDHVLPIHGVAGLPKQVIKIKTYIILLRYHKICLHNSYY